MYLLGLAVGCAGPSRQEIRRVHDVERGTIKPQAPAGYTRMHDAGSLIPALPMQPYLETPCHATPSVISSPGPRVACPFRLNRRVLAPV